MAKEKRFGWDGGNVVHPVDANGHPKAFPVETPNEVRLNGYLFKISKPYADARVREVFRREPWYGAGPL